jgi:hypothetical protein
LAIFPRIALVLRRGAAVNYAKSEGERLIGEIPMYRRKTALAILLTVAGLAFPAASAEAGWFYRPYIGWRGGWSPYGVAGDLTGGQIVGAAQWQRPAGWQQPVIVFSAAQWQQMVQGQQPPNVPVLPVFPQPTNPLTAALLRQQQRDPRFSAIWQQQQSVPPRPAADGK